MSQFNPGYPGASKHDPAALIDAGTFDPVFSSPGVNLANIASDGPFTWSRVGGVAEIKGVVDYDATAALQGETFDINLPSDLAPALGCDGFGVTTNAVDKGVTPGEGLARVSTVPGTPIKMRVTIDDITAAAAGLKMALCIRIFWPGLIVP